MDKFYKNLINANILEFVKEDMLKSVKDKEVVIYKTFNISAGHKLELNYESPCRSFHGHNFTISIWLKGKLDKNGMVADFQEIKDIITDLFDHRHLNEVFKKNGLDANPTSEVLAISIYHILKACYFGKLKVKVRVWETDTSYAEFGDKIENG